jgi:hypothetical protein
VVAPTGPCGPVWRGEQRVHLGLGEVAEQAALEAFGRDREHAGDARGVLGVVKRGEAEQGADRCEPGVSRAGGVAALALEMVEELADELSVDVGKIQVGWLLPGVLLGECQQELERVAVGGNGLRARVPLPDEPVGEELLQGRGKRS